MGALPWTLALPSRPVKTAPAFMVMGSGGEQLPRISIRDLVRIRLGDETAREAFVNQWWPLVESEARRYAAAGGDAQELRAEAALALWEAAIQYDPQQHRSSPERYIANQVHRRVRRAYRRERGYDRPREIARDLASSPALPDHALSAAERRLDVERAVQELPAKEQNSFRQYLALAAGGAGPDEAARTLADRHGGSFAAWKKRLERVRRKVRSHLSST